MTRLLEQAALLCTAAGLIAGALVVGSTRDPRLGLRVALEFFMAAGLLRLAGPLSAMTLATAAGILAVRQLVSLGLRPSPRGGAHGLQGIDRGR
jgi:hypothetical protein